MNKNPLNKGVLTENAIGIGTVTPEMVEARARELAVIAGRIPPQPSQVDYEQAKRELTGEPDIDILDQVLESLPESERWDPVRGSIGHHTPESFGEDEDSEGRSESAQLVEEGIKEAEHDQMLQAARAAQKRDKREHFTMQDGDTSELNEDQNSRRQEDDSIVVIGTERARAAGKYEGAHGIEDVDQRV